MSAGSLRLRDDDASFWKKTFEKLFVGKTIIVGEFYKRAESRPKIKTDEHLLRVDVIGDQDERSLLIQCRHGIYTGCVLFEIHPDERSIHVINRDDRHDEYWWTFTLYDPEGEQHKVFRKAEDEAFARGEPVRVAIP